MTEPGTTPDDNRDPDQPLRYLTWGLIVLFGGATVFTLIGIGLAIASGDAVAAGDYLGDLLVQLFAVGVLVIGYPGLRNLRPRKRGDDESSPR